MTSLAKHNDWISPEEYLAGEQLATVRREYLAGEVYAMAGSSDDHGRIVLNIGSELHRQLRGKKCEAFIADMKVKIPPPDEAYYYPDVVVACQPQRELNRYLRGHPAVVFEVLSPSTRATDLREKRAAYLRIESLEHYITVEQERMELVVLRRKGRNWERTHCTLPEDRVILSGIECELTLEQIYERVSWQGNA